MSELPPATPPISGGAPRKPAAEAADKVAQKGLNSGVGAVEKKLASSAGKKATSAVAGRAAKGVAGKAVTGGQVKPSAGGAAKGAAKKVTDKLADNVAQKADTSTAAGQKKAENAHLAADLAAGAAGGAVAGSKGGVVGAGVGAALGAAKSLAGNATARKRLHKPLMIVAAAVLLVMILPALIASSAITASVAAMSSQSQSDDSATTSSMQDTLENGDGEVSTEAGAALADQSAELAHTYSAIPWQIIAAAIHELGAADVLGDAKNPDAVPKFSLAAVSAEIESRDPMEFHRDLAEGGLRNGPDDSQHLFIIDEKDGGNPATWKQHEETKAIMTDALKAGGASNSEAGEIWETALSWSLGVVTKCDVPSESTNTGEGGNTGTTTGVTLESLSADQLANAKTIIGVAKGMFDKDWKEASVIGLLTSMQESKLQIAANDGIVKNAYMPDGSILADETGRTNEWPLDAYPIVAKSQKFTHQFVGSMYLTLGLFQQMANQHWSDLGSATWATDPDAAVARLMDPEFSSFAFFRGLKNKAPDWKTMDPIAAAEIVQVSGMGENTRKWKDLAEQIVKKHGTDTAKITPPEDVKSIDGTSNTGGNDSVSGETSGCDVGDDLAPPGGSKGEVGANGWAWPTDTRVVFQSYHLGMSVDLGSSGGGPLFAAYPGVVIRAGGDGMAFGSYCPNPAWWRGENKTVMIKSNFKGKPLYSSLNHVGSISVKVGQTVKAGQQVASEGMSGCTSAPHNHFFIASGPLHNGDVEPFQYIGRP